MRRLARAAVITAIAAAPSLTSRSGAQDYPWCANFHDGAGTNCGFATAAQCAATVSGSGGFCSFNTLYKPVAAAPARKRPSRRVSDR